MSTRTLAHIPLVPVKGDQSPHPLTPPYFCISGDGHTGSPGLPLFMLCMTHMGSIMITSVFIDKLLFAPTQRNTIDV